MIPDRIFEQNLPKPSQIVFLKFLFSNPNEWTFLYLCPLKKNRNSQDAKTFFISTKFAEIGVELNYNIFGLFSFS
jgi:hypothetical protein